MANLTSSGVKLLTSENYPLGDRFQKSMHESQGDYQVVLVAQGDGADGSNIPASAFGMSVIREVSGVVKSDNSIQLVATPKYDGSGILLKAAGTNAPAQYTGTFNMRVKGQMV